VAVVEKNTPIPNQRAVIDATSVKCYAVAHGYFTAYDDGISAGNMNNATILDIGVRSKRDLVNVTSDHSLIPNA
jgi:hypothetical protein